MNLLRLCVLALAVMAGCASSARTLRWTIQLAHPDLFSRTELVVARVLVGGCSGSVVVHEVRIPRRTPMMTPPAPLLGPGVYGLQGFALDADCGWVASDCQEVRLPMDGTTALVLRENMSPPMCPSTLCSSGGCFPGLDSGALDAGPLDASSHDVGPVDAPPRDSGPRDATAIDAAVCTATTPSVTGASAATGFLGSVTATGNTITVTEYGGASPASITLAGGVTASGAATPVCPMTDAGFCFPVLSGVFGSGSTITFIDNMGVMHPITLVGATASGSFTMAEHGGSLSATVTTSGNRITFSTWVFEGVPMTGDIVLSPTEVCR